jgi:uncharacterized membrane protein (DUF2068 family)
VTAVGVIGIVAGVFPLAEVIGILLSARFAAWFLPVMRAIVPSRDSLASTLLFGIAVADISFGIGVLARKPWALYGMILRSVIGLPIDYLNFTAGNRAGALVGLTVNVFIVWVLLRADSRKWIGHADSVA